MVSQSSESDADKLAIVKEMTEAFTPETWALNRYMNKLTVGSGSDKQRVLSNSDIVSVGKNGQATLLALGDAIVKYLGTAMEVQEVAAIAWKEGVSLCQKWYAGVEKGLPERYAEKIKAVDPNYVMPKRAGCISLADKKE